jgi:hypothetical protein
MVIWGEAEKVREIAALPDSEYYQTTDGQYFELGVRYNTLHIFWIPVWVKSEPMVCGYLNSDTYVDLTKEEIDEIVAETGIDLKGKVKATLWDKMGGKIVILLIVGGIAFYYFKDKMSEKSTEEESAEEKS